jgi:signal transduction histidine kinase
LEVVKSATALMRRLVNDLVDVARMEMGHLALTLAPVDLADLARRVAQDQSGLTGRSVVVDVPKRLVVARVDATRVIQVLINLLANAFKYSPIDRPVRLRLHRTRGQARFEVQDEGPGIPRAARRRIFERFYQVREIRAQQGSGVGLGLGLYICRQLVELHGGRIDVSSTVGRGSTFWFTLPLARADA